VDRKAQVLSMFKRFPLVIWITHVLSPPFYTENDMLTIKTFTDGRNATLILTAHLPAESVLELEPRWRRRRSCESVPVDLCGVGPIDAAEGSFGRSCRAAGLVVGTHQGPVCQIVVGAGLDHLLAVFLGDSTHHCGKDGCRSVPPQAAQRFRH